MGANGIDNTFLRVAKIQSFANGQPLTNATGFFLIPEMLPSRCTVGSGAGD